MTWRARPRSKPSVTSTQRDDQQGEGSNRHLGVMNGMPLSGF
jgi:hypothetical protein